MYLVLIYCLSWSGFFSLKQKFINLGNLVIIFFYNFLEWIII